MFKFVNYNFYFFPNSVIMACRSLMYWYWGGFLGPVVQFVALLSVVAATLILSLLCFHFLLVHTLLLLWCFVSFLLSLLLSICPILFCRPRVQFVVSILQVWGVPQSLCLLYFYFWLARAPILFYVFLVLCQSTLFYFVLHVFYLRTGSFMIYYGYYH